MQARVNYLTEAPGPYQAMLGVEEYLRASGLDEKLQRFVSLRASQTNGCAFCIDMHWKELRALGEQEQRLYSLDAWRESPYYTDRERAAFEWTDALTMITDGHAADDVYRRVKPHFTIRELWDLTLAIAAINAWNRIVIAARVEPGTYRATPHVGTR